MAIGAGVGRAQVGVQGGGETGTGGPLELLALAACDGSAKTSWVEREYIWGPGDVDECLMQIGRQGERMFVLNDGNNNVVGLTGPTGAMLEQYTYEPYGALIRAESLATHPVNKLGHQGLFFDHFVASTDGRILVPETTGLYYNRNRHYSPTMGRFLQRDPNETAQPLLAALVRNGASFMIDRASADVQGLYDDGMNLYAYVGNNPVNRADRLGLYDEFDEAIDDVYGHRLYALGTLNEGARVASIGLNVALDIAGSFLGLDVFQSIYLISSGRGGFWDAMNIVAAVNPIGRLGAVGGKLSKGLKYVRRGNRTADIVGTAAEHLFKIFPYKVAKKYTAGFKGEIQAHHILEVRHAERWGINTNEIPAVILTRSEHQRITGALQGRLRTRENWNRDQVWAAYQEIYSKEGYSDWLSHIEKYFR